ncbi:MAG: hypothetical protein HYZ72_10845 [Deltaproteobacteria bacterium]|nr:hypothetical protein [Deltaproteobacteria bacterium]
MTGAGFPRVRPVIPGVALAVVSAACSVDTPRNYEAVTDRPGDVLAGQSPVASDETPSVTEGGSTQS